MRKAWTLAWIVTNQIFEILSRNWDIWCQRCQDDKKRNVFKGAYVCLLVTNFSLVGLAFFPIAKNACLLNYNIVHIPYPCHLNFENGTLILQLKWFLLLTKKLIYNTAFSSYHHEDFSSCIKYNMNNKSRTPIIKFYKI